MAINITQNFSTESNLRIAPTTTAAPSPFMAALVGPSSSSFVNAVGTKEEKSENIVKIGSITELYSRLSENNVDPTTADWGGVFYSALSYLMYGGILYVIGSGDPYSLLERSDLSVQAVFSHDASSNINNRIQQIATAKRIVGISAHYQTEYIGDTPNSKNSLNPTTPSVTSGDMYGTHVVGEKNQTSYNGATTVSSLLSADFAGLMAEKQQKSNVASSPAGIESVLRNGQLKFTIDPVTENYLSNQKINYFKTIDGNAVLWGDTTRNPQANTPLSHVGGVRTYMEISRGLEKISDEAMFKANDSQVRTVWSTKANSMLKRMLNSNLLTGYNVVCDETNNPPNIVNSNLLRAFVSFTLSGYVTSIELLMNTNTRNTTTTITPTTTSTSSTTTSTRSTSTRSTSSSSGSSY